LLRFKKKKIIILIFVLKLKIKIFLIYSDNTLESCDCNSVSIVKNCKYLGIEMCSDMKWINQITSVTNKLKKMIYIMKELREILPPKDIRTKYLTLFEPLVSYGIIGWGGAYNNALLPLQKCQNTILGVANKNNWRNRKNIRRL